jgi:hypothetical protein
VANSLFRKAFSSMRRTQLVKTPPTVVSSTKRNSGEF